MDGQMDSRPSPCQHIYDPCNFRALKRDANGTMITTFLMQLWGLVSSRLRVLLNSLCRVHLVAFFAGCTKCCISGMILNQTLLGCVLFGMQKGDDQKHDGLMRPGIRVTCQID